MFHGCGGAYDKSGQLPKRMREYAELFNGAGMHVLVVDSLTPRYEKELCTQRSGTRRVTQSNRRLDALGAVAYLAERADVDAEAHRPDRLVERRQHGARGDQPAPSRRRRGDWSQPAFAVAFYPGCESRPEARLRAGGAAADAGRPADDWTPSAPCRALAREAGERAARRSRSIAGA